MNLEDEIAEELSNQIRKEIDFEVLVDVLVNACGWHRVDMERFEDNRQAVDITTWCHDNAQGNWKRNGCKFVFEDSKDAVMFTLKWL